MKSSHPSLSLLPWWCVITECSLHWVLHYPKINCLLLLASVISHLSVDLVVLSSLHSLNHKLTNGYSISFWRISLQIYHLWVLLKSWFNMASKTISQHLQLWPPNSSMSQLDLGLQVYHNTCRILAFKSISEFCLSQFASTFTNSHNHGVHLHLLVITASVRRYRGNGGGQSDGEYIFGRPWTR